MPVMRGSQIYYDMEFAGFACQLNLYACSMFMVEWEFTYLMTSANKKEHMVSKVIWGSVAWPAQKNWGSEQFFFADEQ